jgi:hypothetical protein
LGRKVSEELQARFEDLPLRGKELIFEKVVEAICFKRGEYNYFFQYADCRNLVKCKL